MNGSISDMDDLDYTIVQGFGTHFSKLSENIYFYQVIFSRFCFIIYFLLGYVEILSLVKSNLRANIYIKENVRNF